MSQNFRGKGSSLGNIFLVSTKLDTFCYPTRCKLHRATCRRFDTIPACDGQMDGIAVANTALAMRALRARNETERVKVDVRMIAKKTTTIGYKQNVHYAVKAAIK